MAAIVQLRNKNAAISYLEREETRLIDMDGAWSWTPLPPLVPFRDMNMNSLKLGYLQFVDFSLQVLPKTKEPRQNLVIVWMSKLW